MTVDPIIQSFKGHAREAKASRRAEMKSDAIFGRLDLDGNDKPIPSLGNAMLILALDPALVGCVGYDEFRAQSYLMSPPPPANPGDKPAPGPYPRAWTRADVANITAYVQRTYCARLRRETIEDAMEADAERNRFHPVREYLATLEWDGVPRLDGWLHHTFGTPLNVYTQAVAAKMLIAAVRRVRKPGVKFDHVPVAQGGQGLGKSSAFAALCGLDWFSDDLPEDLSDKDAAMALRGVWILEMAELTQLLASGAEAVKAFITRFVDRYRPPYGRQVIEVPRQGILVGTTNSEEWLRDATGNRRFWPFDCTKADAIWVREHRDQLWAEAAVREAQGEPHWLEEQDARDEAQASQQERMVQDPWFDTVKRYLDGGDEGSEGLQLSKTTAPQILAHAIEMAKHQQDKKAQMRVTNILLQMGWKKVRDAKGRWWERPK